MQSVDALLAPSSSMTAMQPIHGNSVLTPSVLMLSIRNSRIDLFLGAMMPEYAKDCRNDPDVVEVCRGMPKCYQEYRNCRNATRVAEMLPETEHRSKMIPLLPVSDKFRQIAPFCA